MNNKICSIVLIVYGRLDTTKITFESLIKCTRYPYELIVIENRSTDDVREYLLDNQDKIDHLILNRRNIGKVNANNIGWRLARGRYIATVENDICLKENWLTRCIDLLDRIPELGLICPTNHERDRLERGKTKEYDCITKMINGRKIDIPNNRVVPGTVVARREVIEKVGLHKNGDTLYTHSCPEYSRRMQSNGFLVAYHPDFSCDHIHVKNKTFDRFREKVDKEEYQKVVRENTTQKNRRDSSLIYDFLRV